MPQIFGNRQIVKAAINELAYGGHIAALVSPSMVLTFGLVNDDPLDLPLLAISYLITLIVYSFNYYEELDRDRQTMGERAAYLSKKARWYPVVISGYVALLSALVILYDRQLPVLGLIVVALLAAGILYTLFMKRVTRYVPGYKTYYVSAEWALAAGLMYAVYSGRWSAAFLLAAGGFVFFKVLINTVFCDLKDTLSDGQDGLKTFPVMLGWRRTIGTLCLLSLLSPVPLVLGVLAGAMPVGGLALSAFAVYNLWYLKRADRLGEAGMAPKDYAIADLEFLLWPAAAWIGGALLDWYWPLAAIVFMILLVPGTVAVLFAGRRVRPAEKSLPDGGNTHAR